MSKTSQLSELATQYKMFSLEDWSTIAAAVASNFGIPLPKVRELLTKFPSAAQDQSTMIIMQRMLVKTDDEQGNVAESPVFESKPSDVREGRVYSAGPSVFRADAISYADDLHDIAKHAGFELLHPLDAELREENRSELAKQIYKSNLQMIENCDFVVADLNPFRGEFEMDSGTAFEIGYACALGKPVYGFMTVKVPMVDIPGLCRKRVNGVYYDEYHQIVEDFGLSANLMIACTITDDNIIQGNFRDVLNHIKKTHPTGGKIHS